MKIIILSLLLIPLLNFGQTEKLQYLKNIEWINQNPSEIDNEEFVEKTAELIKFQLFNFPSLRINTSGMKELNKELKGYKYENYFQILYSFNQLAYKLVDEKKFNNVNSCSYSMKKLIESYSIILKNEPSLRVDILDKYAQMDEKELKKKIKKII